MSLRERLVVMEIANESDTTEKNSTMSVSQRTQLTLADKVIVLRSVRCGTLIRVVLYIDDGE